MVNFFEHFGFGPARGVCYSGFREGQQPAGPFPSYQEVKEDLLILQPHCKYLRLYHCDQHARTVLDVIRNEGLDFKIMLGAFIEAEMNNVGCAWGGVYDEELLAENRKKNEDSILLLIDWARKYPEIIFSLSVGNEACVDWTDHMVPVARVVEFTKEVKKYAKQPVTFCENYVPWLNVLEPLAEVADFISIHTYPVWENKQINEALAYTQENYNAVAKLYTGKPVVITEAGWATQSNGRGIPPENANEEMQKRYYNDLMGWTAQNNILTFFFEAFDESWKGSSDAFEPEKHWGLFNIDRTPKLAKQGAGN